LLAKEKLASAEATITGLTIPFQFNRLNIFWSSFYSFSEISKQLESYHIASDYALSFVHARGAFPIVKLYDVPNRVGGCCPWCPLWCYSSPCCSLDFCRPCTPLCSSTNFSR
jgi:hypothetical protein